MRHGYKLDNKIKEENMFDINWDINNVIFNWDINNVMIFNLDIDNIDNHLVIL